MAVTIREIDKQIGLVVAGRAAIFHLNSWQQVKKEAMALSASFQGLQNGHCQHVM